MRLFAFLRPDQERLDTLERRVETLAAAEAAREIAFLDIAERVRRHLGRVAAIEGRAKEREEKAQDGGKAAQTSALLAMKFPRSSGG